MRSLFEFLLSDPAQEHLGVAAASNPGLFVEVTKQPANPSIPTVIEIIGQILETLQALGQDRPDFYTEPRTGHLGGPLLESTPLLVGHAPQKLQSTALLLHLLMFSALRVPVEV
jgi:hypothetical protein